MHYNFLNEGRRKKGAKKKIFKIESKLQPKCREGGKKNFSYINKHNKIRAHKTIIL